jgi:hypothetical protein
MALINSYATLEEFKDQIRVTNPEPDDDTVIERLLVETSRYIDRVTGRRFYASVETRSFDTPQNTINDRALWLDDDLLEVITITNGDATTLASTEYNLYPINGYPKYEIRIIGSSAYYWQDDSNGNTEGVIDVLGIWGYRDEYNVRAWGTGDAINDVAGINAAVTTWTVADSALFQPGHIVKIDNELCIVSAVPRKTSITVLARGDNGSTAAAHDDSDAITIWQVQPDIKGACLEIANSAYKRRFGENVSGVATVTGAGVVITPQDIPSGARAVIKRYARLVP